MLSLWSLSSIGVLRLMEDSLILLLETLETIKIEMVSESTKILQFSHFADKKTGFNAYFNEVFP